MTLAKILDRRNRLYSKFREQHRTAHPDRNRTAGEIYENTKELEDECGRIVRAEYAREWIKRWPK